MITADQLLAHAVGDYILQSHWMATYKTKQHFAAGVHAFCYSIPFLFLQPSLFALAVIIGTHFLIDRYRLARYLVWAKNHLAPFDTFETVLVPSMHDAAGLGGYVTQIKIDQHWKPWEECSATGYSKDVPAWLSVWLLIIADNILHVLINGLAIRYL